MLVIFDFDGTLADSWPVLVEELRVAADHFGHRHLTLDEVEQLRGLPTRQVFASLGIPLWRLPKIAAFMRRRLEGASAKIHLFDGIPEMFRSLHEAGVVIGLVSSNSADTVAKVVGPETMRLVARVECGASIFGKARRFQRLIRAVGADKAATIAVGDESRDLDAAREIGITGIGVEWGYASAVLLKSMGPTVASVHDLTSLLLKRAATG